MNWKLVLALTTFNVVLMASSYTMLIPFLPLYLVNDLGATEDNVNLWSGAIFAISFAVTAVMAPIWGKIADKKGKKLMVIRSSALIALTYFLGSMVQNPLQLFLVRILQGFAAGLWPASLALMSAFIPKSKIGICMGIVQSANISGNIIGPLLGGLLAESFGIRQSFLISSGILTLITLISLFCFKEPPHNQEPKSAAAPGKRESIFRLLDNPSIMLIMFAGGIGNTVILLLQPILTLYIAELKGNSDNLMFISGLVFALPGIAGAIAAPIWGRKGQSKGFFRMLVIAMFCTGCMLSLLYIPNTLLPFALMNFCVGLFFSGIFPSANSILISETTASERGRAFGLFFSAQMIGGTIGPLLGGVMGTYINLGSIFLLSGGIFIAFALFMFVKAPAELRKQLTQHRRGQIFVSQVKADIEKSMQSEKKQ